MPTATPAAPAREFRAIRLACDKPYSHWLILPTASLRELVIRQLILADPGLNYLCRWKDTNGFGLHLTRCEWVGNGFYTVPD